MKKLKLLILLVLSGFLGTAQAQQKANWNQLKKFQSVVKDFRNSTDFYPNFINKSDCFWYRMRTSEGINFYYVDPAKKKHVKLFDMDDMLIQLSNYTRKTYESTEFRYKDVVFDKSGQNFKFDFDGRDYSYSLKTRKLTQLPKKKKEKKEYMPTAYLISPDSTRYIYAYKHNLYMKGNPKKGADTTTVQLTTDGSKHHSYAKYVEDEEAECYPAGRWLKNGRMFLALTEDETMVKDEFHVLDMLNEPKPKLKSYRYMCPGDKVLSVYYIKVVDVEKKKVTTINADKWKDQYVEFDYDNTDKGSEIFFYRYKRTWDEKELLAYDVNTGKLRELYDEVDKPFLDYVIKQTHYINGADEIIFRSERTGWGHFYLYDGKTGKYKRAVTEGKYVTGQVIDIDTINREVYFYGFGREKGYDPYYYMVYRAHLDKPGVKLLTPVNANHTAHFSPSFKYLVDVYNTVDQPSTMVVRNRNGKMIMEFDKPDMKPLYDAGWIAPERFCVKAADGITDLYGVMWKPMDFDSTKCYPIISEVYPGPQYEYVPTSFSLESSQATQLAQLGFIVIQTGHRGGTPMRGKAYHTHGYTRMRDAALADDIAVIKELARRYPYINGKKAGMFGHSGGGFMSAAAICSSDFYSAAVACAGNHDNRIYNRGWIEMNNGIEEKIVKNKENPADSIQFKLKKIHTNIDIAKNCGGHLMIVHGMMDTNVHPAHAFRLSRALMDAGINFDMLALPSSTHGFQSSEDDYYRFKMMNHFAKYLMGDTSGEYILHFKKNED